ncbi:MAG: PDC sensor domain-containing protein [Spirochaetaceae bacterium]|nr:MAG: PDC sensor domain-containing protein [Spirochaetaceae bacterium]
MKTVQGKIILLITLSLLAFAPIMASAQSQDVPKTLVEFSNTAMLQFAQNPMVVESVKAQNAKAYTLSRIKDVDEDWKASSSIKGYMFDLMRNRCSYALMNFQNDNKFVVEAFVMDNKGALVGLTNKTSDYWQGDEAKFTESYKGGSGAIHYGDVEYDDSIGEIVVQVSVPVMTGGKAIGAITFGVSLDRWEQR